MRDGITVPEVAKALGLDPEREHGDLPPKALRRKTSGEGSHCFAIYPPSWRCRIAELFERHHAARAAQQELPL